MSGAVQILRQELPLNAQQAQLMDIVLRESERLNETIKSFLAYARPQPVSHRRFDLRRVVNDTALLLRHGPELDADHTVTVDAPTLPVWFEADEGQVRQVVWNLATNGIRAMPDGGTLVLGVRAGETDVVTLSVRDEGVGMSPEELDNMLQPFHGTFEQGTGLGLAIVHRIVSDYGGEIDVTSAPSVGTTVRIRLPGVGATSSPRRQLAPVQEGPGARLDVQSGTIISASVLKEFHDGDQHDNRDERYDWHRPGGRRRTVDARNALHHADP